MINEVLKNAQKLVGMKFEGSTTKSVKLSSGKEMVTEYLSKEFEKKVQDHLQYDEVRFILKNYAYTMDYAPTRLNVYVEGGTVTKVGFG